MKKDITLATLAILVVGGICLGLAAIRPAYLPTKSTPFSRDLGTVPVGKVVLRVNGEPVTEAEFQAAFKQLPDEMQRQYASEIGKMAFAEQLIRLKLLEQEAHRLALDSNPTVAAQIAADRMNILAGAAAEKIVKNPTDEAVRSFYAQNKDKFETISVSHIVVAYAGGLVKPRQGGTPLNEQQAVNKALTLYQQLKKGADFATLARQVSDDPASAEKGGQLGTYNHGALPKEIEARVFALKTGEISGPIPTRFGIHLFRLDARGTAPIEQVRNGISLHVRQQNMYDRVEVLRRAAKIDFDSKFFPDAKNWPGGRNPSGP
jgi:parvulin-like peptidyl-prolyl isomerase